MTLGVIENCRGPISVFNKGLLLRDVGTGALFIYINEGIYPP
jgi:hypothetical protein